MKLEKFSPTFRNVLLLEVREEKTAGGIYIPSSDFVQPEDRVYQVVKLGRDCIELKEGDTVKLMSGMVPGRIEFKPRQEGHYYLVMEQQITGYER